jgi:U3 small nucleolar RNA-associated protein 6
LTWIEELLIARSHLNGTIISGERNLLPQAIQLNPEEQELRHKLAELECLYILKITERRRILGLDHKEDKVTEDTGELEGSEIQLPTITEEELQKTDGLQLNVLLTSPLTDISANPALNGAVPLAVYSSAIASRPDDISLTAGFYDVFLPFYSTLPFIDSALDTVKGHMEEIFSGRGLTLLIQIKDHARGIESTDKSFPAAIREMIKTATAIPSLLLRDREECCAGLTEYLTSISERNGLDVNLQQVVKVLQGRVEKWRVEDNFR